MTRTQKLLIAAALLVAGAKALAQQNCATICHNGTLVKAIGANAITGHLEHHSEDVLISTDCEYEIQGDECETLSLPKLDFKNPIEIGLFYRVYDVSGRIYRMGVTDENFIKTLPRGGVLFIKVEGYQAKRILIKNRL